MKGTSGNRKGYKIFSFSTTVRNPKRNTEFLEILKNFNNQELTQEVKDKIYTEIIRNGIYKFTKLDTIIKEKYEEGIELTDEEINKIILNNPQKTGDAGRLMTQIRAIKECGFLTLEGKRNKLTMKITTLGQQLIDGYNVENVYTKAMIGLHSKNPQRKTVFNETRPFLNTLFVINEINKKYNNNKGILWHEFAFFVLSMIDCNYKSIVDEIIKYREKFKNERNKIYLENYIYNVVGVQKVNFNTIFDYADDVYRKFDMTGLVSKSGFRENTYIRFNEYNMSKVLSIIEENKNYNFKNFKTTKEYVDYLSNVLLPWEESDEVKREVIKTQKEILDVQIDETESLDKQMEKLNEIYTKQLFDSILEDFTLEDLKRELLILDGTSSKRSNYEEVPDPVRLEWLIAIMTAKIYGSKYVKPNLLLDSNGIPKSHAAGGMADIEFITEQFYCLIEVTLIRSAQQQVNSETTSVAEHLNSLRTNKKKFSLFVAPYIHYRTVNYYKYTLASDNIAILAFTIQKYIDTVIENDNLELFEKEVDRLTLKLKDLKAEEYIDVVNEFKLENNC